MKKFIILTVFFSLTAALPVWAACPEAGSYDAQIAAADAEAKQAFDAARGLNSTSEGFHKAMEKANQAVKRLGGLTNQRNQALKACK